LIGGEATVLAAGGPVECPTKFSFADLRALPSRTQVTRHDCTKGWSCIGGSTVGEYVRERRLACCRRDLADASLFRQSITSIAFRWGFSESSRFSRAFRQAFQMSSRQFRSTCRPDEFGS
jgi:AraC-like DNA-binding protein